MEGQGTFEEETHTEWNDVYPYSSTGQVGSIGWKRKEESWKAFFKETYGEVEVINYALQGCSNYEQFEYLNKNLKDFKNTDLILFGFTSKQRDTSKAINYPFDAQKNSFTKGDLFEKYFYSAVYDDIVYEKIAQTNYLYYQTYAKENNLNILFFDLFESYVNIDNCSKSLISLIDERSACINLRFLFLVLWIKLRRACLPFLSLLPINKILFLFSCAKTDAVL